MVNLFDSIKKWKLFLYDFLIDCRFSQVEKCWACDRVSSFSFFITNCLNLTCWTWINEDRKCAKGKTKGNQKFLCKSEEKINKQLGQIEVRMCKLNKKMAKGKNRSNLGWAGNGRGRWPFPRPVTPPVNGIISNVWKCSCKLV